MRIKKLYFSKMYNQWRGEPLYVEDGLDSSCLYVRLLDIDNYVEGAINAITADFKDLNGATHSILGEADYEKKLAIFEIPLSILSNNGVYEVGFSVSYNSKDKDGLYMKSAIQTFEIIDAIESDDEAVTQDSNYPILTSLINQLADYKVDTSVFPTREEMMEAIEDNINIISMEEILSQVKEKGYITKSEVDKILVNNYATKASLSDYATVRDLNAYVKNTIFNQTIEKYVLKEDGKGLSSNDFTDELYNKLVNLEGATDGEIANIDIDLSDYALKNEIPKSTSSLINDSGFITADDIPEGHFHDNKDLLDIITQEIIDNWNNKSEFSGYYKDLIGIPFIPSKISDLTNDSSLVDKTYVTNAINNAQLGEGIDLTDYAKTIDIPTKISQLVNDSEFITIDDIPEGHFHDNKDILDTITSDIIDTWNNKSDVTINDDINNTSTTQTYSNQMIESRFDEVNTDITAVADDLDSMDNRVAYLEEKDLTNPTFSFNDDGELVVTIDGVSKIFTPKSE